MTNSQGYVDTLSLEGVSGWAADSDDLQNSICTEIFVDGRLYSIVRCDEIRPDLSTLGFDDLHHGFKIAFDPPLNSRFPHSVKVCFSGGGGILENGFKSFAATRLAPALSPILVTAAGRSGTTLLMARLGASPAIAVADAVPYEVRHLSYYALAHKVLTHRGSLREAANPDQLEGSGLFVGHNPFFTQDYFHVVGDEEKLAGFVGDILKPRLLEAGREIIQGYYAAVAAANEKPAARFFAASGQISYTVF